MVVALEAIVESFVEYKLKYTIISSSHLLYSCVNFIGCATSTPDGSSPRGYKGVLAACYRLKYLFWTIFSFLYFINSFFFYILLLFPLFLTKLKAHDFVGPFVCKGPLRVTYK
jgi:hypothetical protein